MSTSLAWLLIVLLCVLFAFLVIFTLKQRRAFQLQEKPSPLRAVEQLLTPAELHFYQALVNYLQNNYAIFCKVRLGDIVEITSLADPKTRLNLRNKINQKHIDFVICEKNSSRILCCIELNDKSHQRADRIRRDEFVRKVFVDAELLLIEIPAQAHYSKETLQASLVFLMGHPPSHANT